MKIVKSLERRLPQVMEALRAVALSGQYAEGRWMAQADSLLTTQMGKETLTLNSCGSALFALATYLRGPHNGNHLSVLVQNNTFYASGAMFAEASIRPVLVDSRSDCPSMSVDSLREAQEASGSRLVCLTHIGGWAAKDYEAIAQFCAEKQLTLVEDCAHVFGVPAVGDLGMAACWSFYPTKAVPIGEGGALSTSNPTLARFVREFRQYGKHVHNWEGVIRYSRGMNLRMSEWDAAVLCTQLEYLPEILGARHRDAEKLQELVPCLLNGPSNYYKYPVVPGRWAQITGRIYARSDQLDQSLSGQCVRPVPLTNSCAWAHSHECLPIGEGLYDGMGLRDLRELLGIT